MTNYIVNREDVEKVDVEAVLKAEESRVQEINDRIRETSSDKKSVMRKRFFSTGMYLEDFFKWWPFDLKNTALSDHIFSEYADFSYMYSPEYSKEIIKEIGATALAVYYHKRPNAPMGDPDLEQDVLSCAFAAYVDACGGEYQASYFDWMLDKIEQAANATGLAWCYVDTEGALTDNVHDAREIVFAVTKKEFMDKSAGWWNLGYGWYRWDDYRTNEHRLEYSDDILQEYITNIVGENKVDTSEFSQYSSGDDWLVLFLESDCFFSQDAKAGRQLEIGL